RLDETVPMPGEDVDLARVVHACVMDFQARADLKQMLLTSRSDEHTIVHAPPTLIRVLLDNLVDNAIKYGRERGSVEIATWQDAGAVCLQVRDDGPGVSDENLSRLQDR
ncbi:ATP-binding protein, partial [Chryseobacterium sp. SIMBA_038]